MIEPTEEELQSKAVAPRVTQAEFDANIVHTEIVKHVSRGGVLRWAILTTRSGFAVTGRASIAVSPENDNAEFGEKIAIANAADQLWQLMGYALRERLSDASIKARARRAHEINRAYCRSIGDESQPAWEDAPDWQRVSAIVGVKRALEGDTPEQLHLSWTAQKIADGWTYAPVKDPEAKTHPCLVPYDQLPPAQLVKDYLFQAAATL